ncbi:MAG: hypothetical protein QXU67_00240 [Candidatus Bathyarchaeia archaeon]
MVFYIVYRASKEHKNRGLIPKRLETLGCKRICNSFWEVNERKIDEALKVVSGNQPILLKRTRDIRKPEYDGEGNLVDFGSLIIVTYNTDRDESGRIRGLLAKTPYIRLCRSVYAFSQNDNLYSNKRRKIVNMNELFTLIKENDESSKILPRMIIMNGAEATEILIERVKLRVANKAEKILDGYKNLIQTIFDGEIEKRRLIEEEKKLYSEFASLRRIAIFYERWLRVDFAKDMMRVYSAIRKLQTSKSEYNPFKQRN